MSYKKYSLKNKKNQDIRPFYLWKEGFIENYKKYCHKDQVKRGQKMPILVAKTKELNKTYHEGFFDSKTITKKNFVNGKYPISNEDQKSLDHSMRDLHHYDYTSQNDPNDPLKTSLFNSQDICSPIKKYFYDKKGMIQIDGQLKKEIGVKHQLENIEKLKLMLKFSQWTSKLSPKNYDQIDDKLFEQLISKGRNNLLESLITQQQQSSSNLDQNQEHSLDDYKDLLMNLKSININKMNKTDFPNQSIKLNNESLIKHQRQNQKNQIDKKERQKIISPNPFKPKISITANFSNRPQITRHKEIKVSFNDYVSQAVSEDQYQNNLYKSFYSDALQKNEKARSNYSKRKTIDFKTSQNMQNNQSDSTSQEVNDISQITPERDSLNQTPQLIVSDLQRQKFMIETSSILEMSLDLIHQISDFNHDSIVSSFLQNWFMKQKLNEKNKLFNDNNSELQMDIMNHIRNLNSKCQKTYLQDLAMSYKQIKEDLTELENDLSRLGNGNREQFMEMMFSDLLINQNEIQTIDEGVQSSFDLSNPEFQIIVNRSQKKLNEIQIDIVDDRSKSESKNQNRQLMIEQERYDSLFQELFNCIFSKEELALLQQIFRIILSCLGGKYSVDLKRVSQIFEEQKLVLPSSITVYDSISSHTYDNLIWSDFIKSIAKLRFDKILSKLNITNQREDLTEPYHIKKLFKKIFSDLLKLKIQPQQFFKVFSYSFKFLGCNREIGYDRRLENRCKFRDYDYSAVNVNMNQSLIQIQIKNQQLLLQEMMNDQSSLRQSVKYYQKSSQNVSPLFEQKDRLSGMTNSGDIVKVKDSNYVVTDVADYTQFAQVSNKIDQSPNMLVSNSQDHNFINRFSKNSGPGVFEPHSNFGISPFQTSGKNPIKTSMNEDRLLNINGMPPNQRQITAIPSTSVFNYSLKSFNDADQEDEDGQKIMLEDSFSEGFQIISKQSSQNFKDQEMEQALYSAGQKYPGTLISSHHRKAPSNTIRRDHSLYSDDQKKSVFLYSSSNDEIIQSQISQRISHQNNQSNRGSSKQSLQLFSNINSNSSVGLGQPLSQRNQENSNNNNHNFIFKTTSSNFQLSDMTMSLMKDGTQSSIVNFNPPNNQNYGGKNFLDTDDFEIKEEDDENCYTPMNQFYPQLTSMISKKNSQQSSCSQANDKPAQIQVNDDDFDVEISQVEDSFQQCDYDDYIEEKCSLSDNAENQNNQLSTFNSNNKDIASQSVTQNSFQQVKIQSCDSNIPNIQNNRTYFQTLRQSSQGLPPKNPHGYQSNLQSESKQASMTSQEQSERNSHYEQANSNVKSSMYSQNPTDQFKKKQQQHCQPEDEGIARQQMIEYLTADCDDEEQQFIEDNEGFVETFGAVDMMNSDQYIFQGQDEENLFQNRQSKAHFLEQENNQKNEQEQDNNNNYDEQQQQQNFNRNQYHSKTRQQNVVKRLLNHQKMTQQKIELQRIQKQNQELLECQKVPQISKNSLQILKSKDNAIPAYLDIENYFDSQRRKEDLKRAIDQAKLSEVTGQPRISQKAQSLSRDVKDLYNWQKETQRKKEDSQRLKEEQERNEMEKHRLKGQNYMNKQSQRMLENKENYYHSQKIEERLINIGVQNKIKKEQATKTKVLEEIQIANQHHHKENRISSKYLMRSKKKLQKNNELTLSQTDLRQMSANKERQDLYQKYYNEKKREAECKLLSTTQLQSAFSMSSVSNSYDANAISRNNLYNQGPFSQTQSIASMNQNSGLPQGLPLSPVQYQSFQEGYNTTSHPYFDLQQPVSYCSFGNIPTSQSFRQTSNQRINPYQTLQNYQQTGQDIYQQMVIQAKSSQCSSGRMSQQENQSTSNASTSCFEAQENKAAVLGQAKLLPPKVTSKTNTSKANSAAALQQQRVQRQTRSSRSRTKSKECQQIQNILRSLSPSNQPIIGQGKLKSSAENDKFYERTRKWSKERQKKIENQQEKINLIQTLKCTFKPNISENSQKLFSPSSQDSRGRSRLHEPNFAAHKQNSRTHRPTNFTQEMLLDQFISSSISPLKDVTESFSQGEKVDPFLEQVVTGSSLNSVETTIQINSGFGPRGNQDCPQIHKEIVPNYNLQSYRPQTHNNRL